MKHSLITIATDTGKVNLLNKISLFYNQTNLDSVFHYAQAAKTASEKAGYAKGLADALMNICRYYQNKGDYSLAMQNCLDALPRYEALKSLPDVASANLMLAQLSKELSGQSRTNEYVDNGITYAKIAYRMYDEIHDTTGMATTLITSGIIYRDKAIATRIGKYYDTAFENYTTALALIQRTGKGINQLARLYNNISQVYLEHKKEYHKALDYLSKAVIINRKENKQSSLSYNYGNISNAYVQLGDHANALKFARLMLEVSRELNRPSRIQNALYQLYQVYKSNKQADSALRYYILSDHFNDSLTDIAKTTQVMELQTKYETGKKEQEIKLLNLESSQKNRRIILLVVALALFISVASWMILLYRRVRKQKQQISRQSNSLELMMKELHHRVKNNLQIVSSLLSLQAYKLDDEASIAVLRESQQRVNAMSLIHQRLYKTDDLTSVNIRQYVSDLAETLLAAYGYNHDDFDLEIDIDKETLDVDKALPIGLIINEMVTNAMKYAYGNVSRPFLQVALKDDGKNMVLTIRDNGKGFDEKNWKQKTGSFGKQLITALGRQLRAEQKISVDNGTTFTVIIPKEAA